MNAVRPLTAAALALLWSSAAGAHDYKLGMLEIGHPWRRTNTGNSPAGPRRHRGEHDPLTKV